VSCEERDREREIKKRNVEKDRDDRIKMRATGKFEIGPSFPLKKTENSIKSARTNHTIIIIIIINYERQRALYIEFLMNPLF
jgi:undecaprenyl pyrophosphate synthase